MTAWAAQPIFYGDVSCLATLFANAATSLQRIAIWGDSRTDPQVGVEDRLFEQRLNYSAFRRFGAASETPIARIMTPTRSSSQDPQFCVPVATANGQFYGPFGGVYYNGVGPIANLPPGFGYYECSSAGAFQVALSLDPRNTSVYTGSAPFPWGNADVFFLNNTHDVVPELFLRKNNASSADRLQWIDAPAATPSAVPGGTSQATGVVTELGFNSGSGVVKWTGPAMIYSAGNYENLAVRGLNSSNAVAAGMQVCGARWRNPNRNRGLVFQSFGQGGYDSAECIANHADMGPTVNTFGPYQAHVIVFGANDAGSPSYSNYLTTYIDKVRLIIQAVKSSPFGGTATTPVVLMTPYVRSDFDFSPSLDAFAQALIDLCDEFTNVAMVNVARLAKEAGYDPTDTDQSDGVHISTIRAASNYADQVFYSLEQLNAQPAPLSDPAISTITFNVWGDEAPLQGAIVRAKLLEPYSVTREWQAGRYMSAATTNSDGVATLRLIRSGEFQVGGTYMIEIYDLDGIKISSYKARVPNEATINASELIRG